MSKLILRPFLLSDIESIGELQPDGWSDICTHFNFFCKQSFCSPVAGTLNGKIIGLANNIKNDQSGWLSHIIVKDEFQRRGIGYKLTEYVLNDLLEKKFETVLLIATEYGEPVYKKIGFETITQYRFFKSGIKQRWPADPNIQPLEKSHLPQIYALDKKMSGEDRSKMLLLHLNNSKIYIEDNSGFVTGFYLPELGEGLIVAGNGQAGMELLKYHLSTIPKQVVVPEENITVINFLQKNGFEQVATAPKMVYGKPVGWNPGMLFSRVGGYFG